MNFKPLKAIAALGAAAMLFSSELKKRLDGEAARAAFLLPESFTVTAHTGCCNTAPNSIESIEKAILSGADILEFDVLDDEGGNTVLAHDYENGKNYVLFSDALEYIKLHSDTIKINIDLKRSDISYAVDEAVKNAGMESRCFLTGVDEEDVPTVAATVSIPYYLNVHPSLSERFDEDYWLTTAVKANSLGAVGINCKYTLISKKGVEICRKNSLLVSLFTPDSRTEINLALLLSPDNITTRNPQTIIEKRSIKQ